MKLKTFRRGGIHPAENKITAGAPIQELPLPTEVVLLLGQHIGAPAKALVAKGEHVVRGQMIAEAGGFVSAPIHTPISGTVTKIDRVMLPGGQMGPAVTIKADEADAEADVRTIEEETKRPERDTQALEPSDIVKAIGQAGIVGLGGATFPTSVKLSPPPGMKPEVVIINGVECEPYLTADHALMLAHPREIVEGTRLLMRAAGVDRGIIAVEANKPDAIKELEKYASKTGNITVQPLKVKYPQGGEKQLIEAVLGREVPSGALPVATGAIVQNVATAYAVWKAVAKGIPLSERIVTVTGPAVSKPGNFLVAIGTPLSDVAEAAGGMPEDTGKIVMGGPMMGRTAVTLDTPMTKGTSGVLFLPVERAARHAVRPCIRCAKCVSVCPMGLEPFLVSTLARLGKMEEAEKEKIMNCIECGSCSWVCPSWRPLLDYIRVGKGAVGRMIRERQSQK